MLIFFSSKCRTGAWIYFRLAAWSLWQGKTLTGSLSLSCAYSFILPDLASCDFWALEGWSKVRKKKRIRSDWQVLLWTGFKFMVLLLFTFLQDLADSPRLNPGNFWTADAATKGLVNCYPLWLRINEFHEEKESVLMSLVFFGTIEPQ